MHTGSYGLTPADGEAQSARPADDRVRGVAWPVRSGLVPPLAEGFIARPETVPRPEAALVPGAAVALIPGQAAAGVRGTDRGRAARPSSRLTWPGRCGGRARWVAGIGGRDEPGIGAVRLRAGRRGTGIGSRLPGERSPAAAQQHAGCQEEHRLAGVTSQHRSWPAR